ncbi:MAG: hypothetical protein RLZZ245_208 [Verrucomicrobiota bacterium]
MGAHAVAGVAGDEAVLKEECARVAGADVEDKGRVLAHGGEVLEAAACFQIDEASHFPVVDGADSEAAGDPDAVHDRLVVDRFAEDIAGDGARDGVGVKPEFCERFLIALDDGDHAFGGGGADAAAAEDVACDRCGFFEEVDGSERSVFGTLGDHHRNGACADVEGCEEVFRSSLTCLRIPCVRHRGNTARGV